MKYPSLVKLLLNTIEYEGINVDIELVTKSLDEALELGNFRFIHDNFGKEIGFYSWEVRHTLTGLDIAISNMIIYKGCEGKYNFMKIINYLRAIYKNINCFMWLRRKTGQIETFKQRNSHEYI